MLPSEKCEAFVLIWNETEELSEQVVWSAGMSGDAKYLNLVYIQATYS